MQKKSGVKDFFKKEKGIENRKLKKLRTLYTIDDMYIYIVWGVACFSFNKDIYSTK